MSAEIKATAVMLCLLAGLAALFALLSRFPEVVLGTITVVFGSIVIIGAWLVIRDLFR